MDGFGFLGRSRAIRSNEAESSWKNALGLIDTTESLNWTRLNNRKRCSKLWSNYGPVIVSQYSETAFGSHPCRGFSINTAELVSVTVAFKEKRPRRPQYCDAMPAQAGV
jgi:hypothetical protein